ncbi:MAG TPA: hypothetical protein VFS32_08555 [Candidatus Limnocylindrales bacterium]|nr:hypothetical protein [Candidatus Limnocylindrales bacterium]
MEVRVLVAAVCAQLFDVATFVVMIASHGPRAEGNPVVVALLGALGPALVIAAKLGVVSVVVCSAYVAARKPIAVRLAVALPLAGAVVFGLIGGLSNTQVLLGSGV